MVAFSILKCSDWTVASKHEQRDRKATPGVGSGRSSTHWSLDVTLVVADTETSVQPGLDTPRPAAETHVRTTTRNPNEYSSSG